ncbi:DUF1801 domain-containing protein (plasmid) [Deinococcus sp. KNUC1210]|uniref:iron chaperone n=1 Tax=Deinococcus sp. KNUC1210 TaxID=2917691 RepID=UPI001EF079E5|nr:DUF1801 domain-containing protein [Deinococcus sp. KNUC1210]ULH17534.1 DUF1801 domain-containing protein [Deinococcus sp. KNUC1210]
MTVKTPKKSSTSANNVAISDRAFTDEEKVAIQERAQELKQSKRGPQQSAGADADGESAVLAKIAEMEEADRALAERLHALMMAHAPSLSPKLWYGMPAYARHGKVVCFFQSARKFKTRYATLGFSDQAALDDGNVWPTVFALKALTPDDEATIVALVRRALG